MINISEKKDCCGCSACAQICPKNAISLQSDLEGFLYPVIDNHKCVNCGICEKTCPITNHIAEHEKMIEGYVAQNLDDEMLKRSTSGGVFGAVAHFVIKEGGCVYGAAFRDDFSVHHIGITREEDIIKLQKSKYVQSEISLGLFNEIKTKLESGEWVCFSGTPCQVEGLKHYLIKEYDNLLTVDIACHSVPSPKALKKYLDLYGGVKNISCLDFRSKKYGYDYSTFFIETKDGKSFYNGTEIDQYMRSFMDNISVRSSCYDCRFKKVYRESDLTIWDCFDIWNYNNNNNNNKGANKVLVHSEKGKQIIDKIKNGMSITGIDVDFLLRSSKEIREPCTYNPEREKFFKDLNNIDADEFWNKYYPIRIKNYLNQFARRICIKIGIYNFVKKTIVETTKKYM